MKNKTAMQELWDYVKDDKSIPFEHYRKLRNKILPLIEKEKEQILKAYRNGEANMYTYIASGETAEAEQYYKEMYENN